MSCVDSEVICIKDKVEVLSRLSKVSNSQWIVSPQQKELFDLESSKEASSTTSPHLKGEQSDKWIFKTGAKVSLFIYHMDIIHDIADQEGVVVEKRSPSFYFWGP